MADKLEREISAAVEEDVGLKEMAQKLAPRPYTAKDEFEIRKAVGAYAPAASGTIEAKLQLIEKQIAEIRTMTAQIRSLL